MPYTSGSAKKNNSPTTKTNSPLRSKTRNNNNKSSSSENSAGSAAPTNSNKARKRKRREVLKSSESELESELENCNLEDAIALERKLRKVAKTNSLNDDEMKMLLQKFVKNEHVLALVTLKAEDELARERRESEQRAILITDTPSVPKLTRAKARELNKTPAIAIPAINDTSQAEIASLIKEDLHSDDDDEEYIFKEEDFVSDDDPNTTISDFDSNPCTPQTPLTQTEYEDSPIKLTADGCFKIPLDKSNQTQEHMRIAARTRSKLCLQKTTIEDIESEFIPPDIDLNETHDAENGANDEDWMQFLNDFSKPLNNNILCDDDDPINDPEYVAADKEHVDAEELRNVNISKKELTELVSELFEGLVNEGVLLESIDLETPNKFLQNNSDIYNPLAKQTTPTTQTAATMTNMSSRFTEVSRQIDFSDNNLNVHLHSETQTCVSDATISSSNIIQSEFPFQPEVMSTPSVLLNREMDENTTLIPVASNSKLSNDNNYKTISIPNATTAPELIAVPVPGHPNHFHIARVISSQNSLEEISPIEQLPIEQTPVKSKDEKNRYTVPYDNNFTWHYISIKRHIYSEYLDKFESLRNIQNTSNDALKDCNQATGFTTYQHDLLQQQLRIHVQMLTQTYLQTYCHPEFWKLAPQVRTMLNELDERSTTDATFNAWNLKGAIDLVKYWEQELSKESQENNDMMAFIHKEVNRTNKNTRQVPRFTPRIMDVILNSNVFMYPMYLPRIPFTPKVFSFQVFAPSESHLIAIGLEKHMRKMKESGQLISKKQSPLIIACKNMSKDIVFGKDKRRIWDEVKKLRKTSYYNPVKYYFEHKRAPPVEHKLITFENNLVLPPIQRFDELPLAWQNYIQEKNKISAKSIKDTETRDTRNTPKEAPSYLDIVREAVGENIQLPDSILEAAEPAASVTDDTNSAKKRKTHLKRYQTKRNSVTINVNYVFGAPGTDANSIDVNSLLNSTTPNLTSVTISPQTVPTNNVTAVADINNVTEEITQCQTEQIVTQTSNIIAYNYDCNLQQLEPVIVEPSTQLLSPNQEQSNLPISSHSLKESYLRINRRRHWRHSYNHISRFGIVRRRHHASLNYRRKRVLKKRYIHLLTSYRQHLNDQALIYKHSPLVLHYYKYFKALELYTEFLIDLKMLCRNSANSSSVANQTVHQNKRLRSDDDASTARSRKINRQEENLRNMLLPDSVEDANRKDAIYAFNFYEKVEELLKSNNRLDDYEKFNSILKSFDPKCDRVADLYYKLESLFLPDYPELAHVFLTFLLPAEAAEIGKFFEHFMITNMTTFINKLNVYFNNQPAQIRKIYNCLSELAEDVDVTMKKIEDKILPLLKGNQFLIDWFMQQFPEAPVPERLLRSAEYVNLKEVQTNNSGEFMETVKDILDSPTSEQQPHCQLRYINGRIFYGSKMTLPAKLSFMAAKYENDETTTTNDNFNGSSAGCIHAIREYGEKRLAESTAAVLPNSANNIIIANSEGICEEINEKSEEDDVSKALIIDTTTCGEDDSCSSIEACDDATLRAHALRLNPGYYSNTCFTSIAATSTPNIGSTHQAHHPNARKQSLNFYDDIKMSPRKMSNSSSVISLLPAECGATNSNSPATIRDKRKSPTKKIKSPNIQTKVRAITANPHIQQPMVVIPRDSNSGAIVFAKKLKSLIESGDEQSSSQDLNRTHVPIIARVKQRLPVSVTTLDQNSRVSDDSNHHFVGKYENSDDMEFLPEHTPPHENKNFPKLQLELDSSIDEDNTKKQHEHIEKATTSTISSVVYCVDSDEDCKLDIVATLATSTNENSIIEPSTTKPAPVAITVEKAATKSNAFTREEDKIFLIEMKKNSLDRINLLNRISSKLPHRTFDEIAARYQFLMDFLSKLQGKQ